MRSRSHVPNRGAARARRRAALDRTTYVLEGPLRYVDRDAACAALLVENANAAGRQLVGRTVTLDLDGARIDTADRNADGALSADDLLSGERVVVSVRLPRSLGEPPAVLEARRVVACRPSAAV